MAPAVAPMFRDVISSLQQLPQASEAEADRLFGQVQRTLEKALSENTTATEWKAVVHKAKVCRQKQHNLSQQQATVLTAKHGAMRFV